MARAGKSGGGEGWDLVRHCPSCGKRERDCACRPAPVQSLPAAKQRPRFRMEKRRGKPVTVITHLTLTEADSKELAGRLKARLGTGGTVKEGEIELQGDHRQALPGIFAEFGFRQ